MSATPPAPAARALMRVAPDDAAYQRMADEEAAFWRSAHGEFGVEAMDAAAADGPFERYANRRFTGDARRSWYEAVARSGPFERGLVLGTAGMRQDAMLLAANPRLHLTICDLSAETLGRWERDLGRRFPGRVSTQPADLNFLALPASSYDLVVSSSTLHHITNLEHLASQVNRALTPGGRFFLHDFVGESMFAFPAAKKRVFEQLYARDAVREGRPAAIEWRNEDRSQYSPFCGVRSGDILAVFGEHLQQRELRTCGAVVNMILYARPVGTAGEGPRWPLRARVQRRLRRLVPVLRAWPEPTLLSPTFVRELLLVDEMVSEAAIFRPHSAFAEYGKRP